MCGRSSREVQIGLHSLLLSWRAHGLPENEPETQQSAVCLENSQTLWVKQKRWEIGTHPCLVVIGLYQVLFLSERQGFFSVLCYESFVKKKKKIPWIAKLKGRSDLEQQYKDNCNYNKCPYWSKIQRFLTCCQLFIILKIKSESVPNDIVTHINVDGVRSVGVAIHNNWNNIYWPL